MVKHLGYAHRWWFRIVFADEAVDVPWTAEDPAADWRLAPEDTYASVSAFYQAEIDAARAITLAATPDSLSRRPGSDFSLRWILAYMIQETARHNGHADILCELLDGSSPAASTSRWVSQLRSRAQAKANSCQLSERQLTTDN